VGVIYANLNGSFPPHQETEHLGMAQRTAAPEPLFTSVDAPVCAEPSSGDWKRPPREWFDAKAQFAIMFGERFAVV
jgi:hypothetical protein